MTTLALGALCLGAILCGAWLVGAALLPLQLCDRRGERLALGGVLGLLALGQLDFLLRLGGGRLAPAALAGLVCVAAGVAWARRARVARRGPGATGNANGGGTDLWPLGRLGVLLITGGVPLFLLSLYPPVDPDPGLYHLPFARGFMESCGLPFFANLRFPVFPQLSELLFAFGLRLHGTTGAHLVEVALALFTGLLLWVWGRALGDGGKGGNSGEAAGLWAAALWLGNPMVVLLGSTAHVDVGLACLVLAGLYCLERERTSGRLAWSALAGAFLGGAAAVKYLGLYFLAAGAAVMAWREGRAWWRARQGHRRRRLGAALGLAVAAAVVAVPVYGHILALTGNPIFPFFPQVFGFTEWTHDEGVPAAQMRPIPVPWTRETAAALVRFPAQRARALLAGGAAKVAQLVRAERDPPHIRWLRRLPDQGRAAVLLVLAAAWGRALWRPPLRVAVGVALLSLLVWLSTLEDVHRLDPRYILAAGPPLALAAAAALAAALGWLGRVMNARRAAPPDSEERLPVGSGGDGGGWWRPLAALVLALALVAPGALYARTRCRYLGPLPLDAAARSAVQNAHLPGFSALAPLARRHGRASSVYGLQLATLTFDAPGAFLGDWFGPQRYAKLDSSFGSGEALYAALRQQGADHFLVLRGHLAALPHDPAFAAHFQLEFADATTVLWELRPLPGTRP